MLFISFSSQILAEVSLCCLLVRSWLDLLAASCFPFCSILFPPPAIFLLHGFSAPGRLYARQRSRFFPSQNFSFRRFSFPPAQAAPIPCQHVAVSRSRAEESRHCRLPFPCWIFTTGLQPDFSSSRSKRVGDVSR
jgi:hypothetical protein